MHLLNYHTHSPSEGDSNLSNLQERTLAIGKLKIGLLDCSLGNCSIYNCNKLLFHDVDMEVSVGDISDIVI